MGKETKRKKNPKETKQSTATTKSTPLVNAGVDLETVKGFKSTNTGKIGYKVIARDFQLLLSKWLTAIGALAQLDLKGELDHYQPNEDDLELLGIQFDFEKSKTNQASHISISQLYYFKPFNTFLKHQLKDEYALQHLADDFIYEIIKLEGQDPKTNMSISYHQLSREPLTLSEINAKGINYERLDYFKDEDTSDEIGFIYFTIDQIEHLVRYYAKTKGTIIISGAQLNLGKKLGHRDDDPKIHEGPYFSLKIEGDEGEMPIYEDEDHYSIDAPDIAIGHPCPPDWYTFPVFLDQVRKVNPTVNYKALNEEWMSKVYTSLALVSEES